MVRKAMKMKLFHGMEAEYERRHHAIWPEVKKMIQESGISNYSIFWDSKTNDLFAYMEVDDDCDNSALSSNAIRMKWWDYMKDIMETNSDNSPVSTELREVFYID